MVNENDWTAGVDDTPPSALASATKVIFMVPDGFGDLSAEAYRYFKGSDPLWESGFQARVQTASASSSVTDSAAAATAYATGEQTDNGKIAVDVDGNPLVSILTLAYEAGKQSPVPVPPGARGVEARLAFDPPSRR